MSDGQFWLTVEQFGRLEPHLPRDTRGKPRVDDRRVISGIVHVLKSGGRWADAPPVYGPRKTLYNRFVRWAAKGVWENIFHTLGDCQEFRVRAGCDQVSENRSSNRMASWAFAMP
ncbi:transposase, partial [Azospirillum brasilense]